MRVVLVLMIVAATARAEPEKATPAENAASAWLAALVDPKGAIAAPTKDKPLDYLIDSPAKSCRALKAGRATTPAEAGRVKKCVFDTWKGLADGPTPASAAREWDADKTFDGWDRKYRKRMKEVARDATIVSIQYIGSGYTMNSSIVAAKDGTVRAIWMEHGEFE